MGSTLLEQGTTLMLVGMGTVFVFLTVLVAAMSLLSTVAVRFSPGVANDDASAEEVAAISAAIAEHKKTEAT